MKKILVVDDEPAVLFALSEALTDRRRGLKVVTARDGREAMSVLEAEKVHLVVTDLRMPEVDGFELLAHLRRSYPSLPVILMTALGSAETSARLGSEALECLSKPFDVGFLRQKIADMLAQRVRGRVENISLSSFLQLLEIERKTCTLTVTSGDRSGKLYFRGGKLIGAETRDLADQEAALEIVAWEHADIEISDVCPVNAPPLPGGLAFLLMEAMRLEDERTREEAGNEEDELEALLASPVPAAAPSLEGDPTGRVRDALERGRAIEGVIATLLAETASGAVIAAALGNKPVDLEAAAAATAEFARRKGEVEEAMGLRETVEEILLTASKRCYLVRPLEDKRFLLMILDRRKTDFAQAQAELAAIARELP